MRDGAVLTGPGTRRVNIHSTGAKANLGMARMQIKGFEKDASLAAA